MCCKNFLSIKYCSPKTDVLGEFFLLAVQYTNKIMTINNIKNNRIKTATLIMMILTIAFSPTEFSGSNLSAFGENNAGDISSIGISQKLVNAHDQLTKMMVHHETKDIPVNLSYVAKNSTLMIGIDDKSPLSKLIYKEKLTTLLGNIPMNIQFGHFIDQSCSSKTSTCSPLIGGIEVETTNGTYNGSSTLTLPATLSDGITTGFIMSGHGAFGETNISVGQPDFSNIVGSVTENPSLSGTRQSDSAFVTTDSGISTSNQIYGGYTVIGTKTSSQAGYDTSVEMQGYVESGIESGTVLGTGLTITNPQGGTLQNQVAANYYSQDGDSGAPVFSTPDSNNNVYLYGIHVGIYCFGGSGSSCSGGSFEPIYSPWEGIKSDLGLQ